MQLARPQPPSAFLLQTLLILYLYTFHLRVLAKDFSENEDYGTHIIAADNDDDEEERSAKERVDHLGEILKRRVEEIRRTANKQVDLVFLVDSSASVGLENFFDELKFVKKLLSDFTVAVDDTRVAVITFSSKALVVRHIDYLSQPNSDNHKCSLLEELPKIRYAGGGTFTLGAVLEAKVSPFTLYIIHTHSYI